MKKQKFCYAAVAACVGLCSLGSCSQEEMAYQGEQKDISKLKVMTRTDDESSKPEEGKIYIFNQNNVCIDTISPSALRDNTPTRIKPGTVKLIAIGSNDLSAYNLPYKSIVTDSSIIKRKSPDRPDIRNNYYHTRRRRNNANRHHNEPRGYLSQAPHRR